MARASIGPHDRLSLGRFCWFQQRGPSLGLEPGPRVAMRTPQQNLQVKGQKMRQQEAFKDRCKNGDMTAGGDVDIGGLGPQQRHQHLIFLDQTPLQLQQRPLQAPCISNLDNKSTMYNTLQHIGLGESIARESKMSLVMASPRGSTTWEMPTASVFFPSQPLRRSRRLGNEPRTS